MGLKFLDPVMTMMTCKEFPVISEPETSVDPDKDVRVSGEAGSRLRGHTPF